MPTSPVLKCSPTIPPPPRPWHSPFSTIYIPCTLRPKTLGNPKDQAKPQSCRLCGQLTLRCLPPAATVKPLFQTPGTAPGRALPKAEERGPARGPASRPEAPRGGRAAGRSPLRPTLQRGPHQGSELRLLGLHIRSLTAASAFRHLVRRPGPAGPDIRLAHGVLWAAPTHARRHAYACARPSPPSASASPPRPHAVFLSAEADGRGHVRQRTSPAFSQEGRSQLRDLGRADYEAALHPSGPLSIPVLNPYG